MASETTNIKEPEISTKLFAQEGFFNRSIADGRYIENSFFTAVAINPVGGSRRVTYRFKPLPNGGCYRPNNIMCNVSLVLCDSTGNAPQNNIRLVQGGPLVQNKVQPVNGIGHCLFEDVQLTVSGTRLNTDSGGYFMKAFLKNQLSTSLSARNSRMQEWGYYSEVAAVPGQGVFSNHHRARYMKRGVYSLEQTDLSTCTVPLPPGCSLQVDLIPTPHSLRVKVIPGDTRKYKLVIDKMTLTIQTCVLVESVFNEFRTRIKKPKAFALVPWRQTELKKVVLSTGSSGVDLTDLFPTNVVPAKLTIAFVRTSDLEGDYEFSPFIFARAWSSVATTLGAPMCIKDKDGTLISHLDPAQWVYLKSVTLKVGGEDFDQLEDHSEEPQTLTDAMKDYRRFNMVHSWDLNALGSGVTYAQFCTGAFYTKTYDLTANLRANAIDLSPIVRIGHYRLLVKFSGPLPTEITMLMMEEYSNLFGVDAHAKIKTSFTG